MKVIIDLTKEETIWRGGKYEFALEISANYPNESPKVKCITQIYHPNIDMDGNVCLNILRGDWQPVMGINTVVMGPVFLYIEPNPNDPLNHDAAALMRDNFKSFTYSGLAACAAEAPAVTVAGWSSTFANNWEGACPSSDA